MTLKLPRASDPTPLLRSVSVSNRYPPGHGTETKYHGIFLRDKKQLWLMLREAGARFVQIEKSATHWLFQDLYIDIVYVSIYKVNTVCDSNGTSNL